LVNALEPPRGASYAIARATTSAATVCTDLQHRPAVRR